MKKTIIVLLSMVVVIGGCASDPERRMKIAKQEVVRLKAPDQLLASYSNFELLKMDLSDSVAGDQKKVAVSKQLEEKLKTKLLPLLSEWQKNSDAKEKKSLLIKPKIISLRIIGGATRFFAGAFVGNSSVDMDLILIDEKTNTVIAKPRINRASDAVAGAFTIGATDRNLLDYIVDISHQYLADNYNTQVNKNGQLQN